MAHTYDTWFKRYPEFDIVPQAAAEAQLEDALLMLSPTAWGKYYDRAQALWTAHYLALRFDVSKRCKELGMRSPYDVGTATSMNASTGSLAVTKSTSALLTGDDPILSDFARTLYGLEYLDLLYTVIPAGGIVYSPDTSDTEGR